MCTPQWSHHRSGARSSCRITTFDFRWQYTNRSLSLPSLCTLSGHLFTIHATNFNIYVKDIAYVYGTPPPTSTHQVYGMTVSLDFSMCWRSDNATISIPHSLQLNLVLFCFMNVSPFPVNIRLYASYTCFPHIKPGVHIINLVLWMFVWSPTISNMLSTAVSVVCTHMGLLSAMRPSST